MSAEPQKVETSTPATGANYNTTPTRDVDHIKQIADAYHHDSDYSNDSSKLGMPISWKGYRSQTTRNCVKVSCKVSMMCHMQRI